MPIERKYFREDNFVLTLIYGELTSAQLSDHVIQMNQENSASAGLIELADCRHITDVSQLSGNSLILSAGMERGQARTLGGLGAIVVASDEIYGLAMMYATIAKDSRIDSRVYRSMDEAIEWLGVGHLKETVLSLCDDAARKIGVGSSAQPL
jgi:hypothetical protein